MTGNRVFHRIPVQFGIKTLMALCVFVALPLAHYALHPTPISFDALAIDETVASSLQLVEELPDHIKRWNNRTVRVCGFIHAPSVTRQTGIERFVLVRDNQMCSPGPRIDDWIVVTMAKGHTTEFSVRPVAVTGRLSLTDEYRSVDGTLTAIYEIKASHVSSE